MLVEWVRDIRDQCTAQSVAFFFKQWGGLRPKSGGRELDGREWNELPATLDPRCDDLNVVPDPSHYVGREQALIKHTFLQSYLERLIHKTAKGYEEIAYIDGFSGPWQSKGQNYEDTSFGIAGRCGKRRRHGRSSAARCG